MGMDMIYNQVLVPDDNPVPSSTILVHHYKMEEKHSIHLPGKGSPYCSTQIHRHRPLAFLFPNVLGPTLFRLNILYHIKRDKVVMCLQNTNLKA